MKLIYIDPPFATKSDFGGKEGETSYRDKIEKAEFLEVLRERLIFMRELLDKDGSLYLHCDWRVSSHIRVLLDEIFGKDNHQNEIIWHFIKGASGNSRFGRKHQTIFWYTKTLNFIFNRNAIGVEYNPETIARATRGEARYNVTPEELLDRGKNPGDVWSDLHPVQGNSTENTNYPTQKPESLLERIIKASSNSGDIVMDCFAGSGTTGAVAEKLGRRWIMCDFGKHAIYTMQKRLLEIAESKKLGDDVKNNEKYGKNPNPFCVVSVGAYDFQRIMNLRENKEAYVKFVG